MAIDTKAKRMSVAGLSPIGPITPEADGTISAADRRTMAGVYSGIETAFASTAATIESALYAILVADETIAGLVSTRVYPLMIPQPASVPAITYEQLSGWREHTMTDRIAMASPVFRVTSWATTYSGCDALAKAVRTVLNTASGTEGNITVQVIFLINETDVIERVPGVRGLRRFGRRQDYKIWFNEILN